MKTSVVDGDSLPFDANDPATRKSGVRAGIRLPPTSPTSCFFMSLLRIALPAVATSLAACATSAVSPMPQGSNQPPRSSASYDAPPLHVNRSAVLVGQRRLDEDVWEPLDQQFMAAIEVSRVNAYSGNGYEFGLIGSYDDQDVLSDADVDMLVLDLFAGFRVQKPQGTIRPFIAFGGAITYVDVGADLGFASGSEQTATFGGYVHGGINLEIARDLDLVFEVRQRVGQDADFNGTEVDIDNITFAIGMAF